LRLALSNGPNRVGVSPPSLEDRNRSSFRNVVFFRIPDDGQSPKPPVIPSVIHRRQNPLESTRILTVSHIMIFHFENNVIGHEGIFIYNVLSETFMFVLHLYLAVFSNAYESTVLKIIFGANTESNMRLEKTT
jgi:hypothetical protein